MRPAGLPSPAKTTTYWPVPVRRGVIAPPEELNAKSGTGMYPVVFAWLFAHANPKRRPGLPLVNQSKVKGESPKPPPTGLLHCIPTPSLGTSTAITRHFLGLPLAELTSIATGIPADAFPSPGNDIANCPSAARPYSTCPPVEFRAVTVVSRLTAPVSPNVSANPSGVDAPNGRSPIIRIEKRLSVEVPSPA